MKLPREIEEWYCDEVCCDVIRGACILGGRANRGNTRTGRSRGRTLEVAQNRGVGDYACERGRSTQQGNT